MNMEDMIKLQVPKAETYFAIPNDLSSLKGLSVLEYLKRHVWLSYQREKECRQVFKALLQENLHISMVAPDFLKRCNVKDFSPKDEALSICFLHKGLLQLYHVLLSSKDITDMMLMLEHDKSQFKSMNFREWCVISAFAERHIFAGPFRCSVLEFEDIQHYKEHGNSFDIPEGVRKVFDIVDHTHRMPNISMC